MQMYHRAAVFFLGPRILLSLGLCSAGVLLAAVSVPLTPTANTYKWTQLGTTTLSERQHSSVAFDAATSQLVVFGGDNSVGVLNDTWVFFGTRWNRLLTPQSPPARTSGALVYNLD